METNRQDLSEILHRLLEECGEESNVYFQPPETVKLKYPCFIYRLRTLTSQYADDLPYKVNIGYDITYITNSPVSEVPALTVKQPMFAFDRYYVADNLHHYAYTMTTTLKEI